MHRDHKVFEKAIKEQRKIRLIFLDNDKHLQAFSVIPLDYNPGRRATDKSSCYHFWDLKVGTGGSPLMVLTEQIQHMEMDPETFAADDFVKVVWKDKQHRRQLFIKRDWGMNLPETEEEK